MAEDLHDLFDGGEDDESDGSEEESDEGSGPSDGSAGEPDEGSLDEGGSVEPPDPPREEPADSTSTGAVFDDDTDESGMTWSSSSSGGDADEDVGESEPAVSETSSGEPVADDTGESEAPPSTTATDTSTEDDAGASETTGMTSTSREEATPEETSESRRVASTSPPEDDAGGAESEQATTATAETAEDERDEAGPAGATTSEVGTSVDDDDPPETGGPSTPEGPIASDGPIAEDRDVSETGGPDEPTSVSGTAVDGSAAATASRSNRLPTGIDELDRAMGGGVPPGRMVLLVSDPGVQSELIVDSVLAQRDTLYVTTDRPDWEVMKDIEPGLGPGEVVIREHSPDSLLLGVDSLLNEIQPSSNFVLDSVNELELVPRQRYRSFISDVKRRLFDTGSVGLLTGVTVDHESARDLTLRRADIVWRLETRTTDREIENRLSVPKFRGGAAMKETVELELTDEVRVDTSWKDE